MGPPGRRAVRPRASLATRDHGHLLLRHLLPGGGRQAPRGARPNQGGRGILGAARLRHALHEPPAHGACVRLVRGKADAWHPRHCGHCQGRRARSIGCGGQAGAQGGRARGCAAAGAACSPDPQRRLQSWRSWAGRRSRSSCADAGRLRCARSKPWLGPWRGP